MAQRSNLPPLPPTKDGYWDEAKTYSMNLDEWKPRQCEHSFKVDNGRAVKCVNCGQGYFLGFKDELVDGHIHHNGELII